MLIDSSLSNYDFKIKGQNKLKLLFANTKSDLKATVSPPLPSLLSLCTVITLLKHTWTDLTPLISPFSVIDAYRP